MFLPGQATFLPQDDPLPLCRTITGVKGAPAVQRGRPRRQRAWRGPLTLAGAGAGAGALALALALALAPALAVSPTPTPPKSCPSPRLPFCLPSCLCACAPLEGPPMWSRPLFRIWVPD